MNVAALQKYDTYKDSGVQWIGEIPSHWRVERSKWLFHDRKEKARKGEQQLAATQKYGVIPQEEFMDIEGRRVTQVFLDFSILKHVEAGDFVMSMRSFQGGLEYSNHTGCVSSAYVALQPQEDVYAQFYKYLLKSQRYIEALQATSNLVRDGQALRFENFSMVDLFLPPGYEQQAISEFLDGKCAKIDEAVRIKEEQIALLRERRQILIQEAVTRGLNPDAPMKDSGIDWVGQIPAHWEVLPLKYIAKLRSGDTISSESFTESGYPVYGGNGFRGYTSGYTHRGHFALIGRQGALCGNVNYAAGEFFASEHAIVATPKRQVKTVWLGEIIRCANFNRLSQSAAQPGISVEVIGNQRLPLPLQIEQQRIVEYVEREAGKIDKAISLKESQINALREYKTSLINSAVTGKIKVT